MPSATATTTPAPAQAGATPNRAAPALGLPNTGGPWAVSNGLLFLLAGGVVLGVGLSAVLAKRMLRLAPATSTASSAKAREVSEYVNGRPRRISSHEEADNGWLFVLMVSAATLTIVAIVRALSKPGR